ncbi:MAG: hypothetical protein CVU05_11825 [Bacteroidetes bacterium HGW-Bacteroidetes-21]|jgi:hypothetical protein|nr:MAG: hypothetical protein CVU05_11825 [Bacteroidetes bacterium HGW-Bacteroidetes-21]
MKQYQLIIFTILTFQVHLYGQPLEFPKYSNGLIYNDTTMEQLAFLVDSLNLKYKNCDLNKKYYAKAQANCHRFEISELNLNEFRKDIDSGLSFEKLSEKYPQAFIDKNLLLFSYNKTGYRGDKQVVFRTLPLSRSDNSGEYDITVEDDTSAYFSYRDNNWIIWFRP